MQYHRDIFPNSKVPEYKRHASLWRVSIRVHATLFRGLYGYCAAMGAFCYPRCALHLGITVRLRAFTKGLGEWLLRLDRTLCACSTCIGIRSGLFSCNSTRAQSSKSLKGRSRFFVPQSKSVEPCITKVSQSPEIPRLVAVLLGCEPAAQ